MRPAAFRGTQLAAGAIALALGVVLVELRLGDDWSAAGLVALDGGAALLVLGIGLAIERPDWAPRPSQSALLVTGVLLAGIALLRLADAIVDGGMGSGTIAWVAAGFTAAATVAARRSHSAACTLLGAAGTSVAVIAAYDHVVEPADLNRDTRLLLLVLAVVFAARSLTHRDHRARHASVLLIAAGLAVLAIAVSFGFPFDLLFAPADDVDAGAGWGWEALTLAAAAGLIAAGTSDRDPGPAWTGVLLLAAFVYLADGPGSLRWWPLALLAFGAFFIVFGLRPRGTAPPDEPEPPPLVVRVR